LACLYSSVAALTAWAKCALSRRQEASSSESRFSITRGLRGIPVRSSKPVLSVPRSRLPSIKGRSGARAAGRKRVLSLMPSGSASRMPCWPWCIAGCIWIALSLGFARSGIGLLVETNTLTMANQDGMPSQVNRSVRLCRRLPVQHDRQLSGHRLLLSTQCLLAPDQLHGLQVARGNADGAADTDVLVDFSDIVERQRAHGAGIDAG
jgi:hypothetical protein